MDRKTVVRKSDRWSEVGSFQFWPYSLLFNITVQLKPLLHTCI